MRKTPHHFMPSAYGARGVHLGHVSDAGPRVAVVGSGYVGTVVAACLAMTGCQVVALEIDQQKLTALRDGHPPFFEPGLEALLTSSVDSGRLRFTDDVAVAMAASDVVFVCVGTPPGSDGHPDMRAIATVARAMGAALDHHHVLVTKSTAPIGTGNWLAALVDESLPPHLAGTGAFSVVSCPEFLREGSAIDDFLLPDRVVLGGADQYAIDQVIRVYRPILDQSFPGGHPSRRPALVRTSSATAETVKYASNAFLAMKISFINEIANICELVGADVGDVATALGLDPRIGPRFLDAGVGWGGSCFGKDLAALVATAADYGHRSELLEAVIAVNVRQRRVLVDRLRRHLKTLAGKRVALLGLAFKAGTDDVRDAPAIDVATWLLAAGALVSAHDPMVKSVPALPGLRVEEDPYITSTMADAVVVLTDWPEYMDLDLVSLREGMRGTLLIDGRNVVDPAAATAAGFVYEGIGRAVALTAKNPGASSDELSARRASTRVGPVKVPGARGRGRPGRHYLFFSHDGYGLGHVRRNSVIARAVLDAEPNSTATIVTGIPSDLSWLGGPGMSVVRVPPLIKRSGGGYVETGLSFDESVRARSEAFLGVVRTTRPDVVVVDRHPYGTGGELRPGLKQAAAGGAALVLGLRDVLDDPDTVAAELAGPGWADVAQLFDEVLVYGSASFCDHQREYGLAVTPTYCGWVVGPTSRQVVDPRMLVVTAGGGGDGANVFRLGLAALDKLKDWHGVFASGPYADASSLTRLARRSSANGRLVVRADVAGCAELFARTGAVVQMAGYNSTFEALDAGCRPVLVPRCRPRCEQLIRATRLGELDLVDVLAEDADPSDLVALLGGPRRLPPGALERAGIRCDGARRAASVLVGLAHSATAAYPTGLEVSL